VNADRRWVLQSGFDFSAEFCKVLQHLLLGMLLADLFLQALQTLFQGLALLIQALFAPGQFALLDLLFLIQVEQAFPLALQALRFARFAFRGGGLAVPGVCYQG